MSPIRYRLITVLIGVAFFTLEAVGMSAAQTGCREPGGSVWRSQGDVYHVGEGVTAPRIVERVEPEYTNEAREKNACGLVVIYCAVSTEGRADKVRIVKPLGYGLDEAAVAAVKKWRFAPAKKDGVPVAASATLEIQVRADH